MIGFPQQELATPTLAQYGGGSGTLGDPYLISTAKHLRDLTGTANDWDKHFKLTADLNLTDKLTPIGGFTGTFYGNGHTIAKLKIQSTMDNYAGLFGIVGNALDPNTIYNLGLINPDVTEDWYVGALVGRLDNGALSGCYVDGGSVNGTLSIGALVGINYGTMSNCCASGTASGTSDIGGFVGRHDSGII